MWLFSAEQVLKIIHVCVISNLQIHQLYLFIIQ